MKHVNSHDFEAHPKRYLSSDEPLTVERNGHSIGYYIPSRAGQRASLLESLDRLEKAVERVLAETGLAEDELADLFDLNKPFEEQLERLEARRASVAAGADAAND
jgi:hypothetical protein